MFIAIGSDLKSPFTSLEIGHMHKNVQSFNKKQLRSTFEVI